MVINATDPPNQGRVMALTPELCPGPHSGDPWPSMMTWRQILHWWVAGGCGERGWQGGGEGIERKVWSWVVASVWWAPDSPLAEESSLASV